MPEVADLEVAVDPVLRGDQEAPAEVVAPKTFVELGVPALFTDALSKLGITTATAVQAETVPAAATGKDLVVQAQTGSGKTLAYTLPLLMRLRTMKKTDDTYALIVTPTRELAVQVREVFRSLTDEVKPVCLIGGASSRDQIDDLGEDRRVIVGTPGRIIDLLRRKEIKLSTCGYFVLDEADEMLSLGFLEDVRTILSRLPDKRQGLFISATITPRVQMLAQSFLTKATTIVIAGTNESPADIEHLYCEVGGGITEKAVALCDLIETQRPRSVIIFCNTKSDTELVEVYLRRRGFDARRINSDLSQAQRDRIMKAVRAGDLRILIATDIAARGIDIEQIDLVVNYSIHEQHETYVHRTGRTGRAGRSGKAISLVGPQDFGAFYGVRRQLSSIEMTKMEPPTEEEVRLAKLAHFYELVREHPTAVSVKEQGLAKSMLKELGDVQEPSEELVAMVAKLYAMAMASFTKPATSALDEESELDAREEQRPRPTRDQGRRDGGGRREDDQSRDRRDRPQGRSGRR
jgi:ATP-dependent RNA helicase DeaD